MVMHMVHLKTLSSLGHRTNDAHVMQLPVAKSLLPDGPTLLCISKPCLAGIMPPSSTLSNCGGGPPVGSCPLFLPLKREGKGWLMERECVGRRWGSGRLGLGSSYSESEELDSAWMRRRGLEAELSRCSGSAVGVSSARE